MNEIKRIYVPINNDQVKIYEVGEIGLLNFFFNRERQPETEENIIAKISVLLSTDGTPVGYKLWNKKDEVISIVHSQTGFIEYM